MAMGASENNCLACYRQQVKCIHIGLRKVAICWIYTGAGAAAFAYLTSKILFIKDSTVILLAIYQVQQIGYLVY